MRFIIISALIIILLPMQIHAVKRKAPANTGQVMFSYAPLVKKAAPAVVNIYTRKKVRVVSPLLNDPVFRQFFGNQFGGGLMRERIENSLGSGVIIRPEGLIITNNHVIKNSDEITVVLNDRREFAAQIVLADPKTDLALLKIKAETGLPFLEIGNSDNLEVGDIVLAIGNPFGVGQTVTQGIISALSRTAIGISDFRFFIQTDAPINPGNSGGALLGMDGRLVGVNTAIFSRSGGSNGIGFAIPSNILHTIISGYENGGKIIRPWFGVQAQSVTADIAKSLNLGRPGGLIVRKIYEDSPALKAGIRTGDIILSIDGREIVDEQSLKFRVATYQVGQVANFVIFRDGRKFTVSVKMDAPPENIPRNITKITGRNPLSGAMIANLSPALAIDAGLSPEAAGVVVMQVIPDSYAKRLSFKPGDILKNINGVEVASVKAVKKALSEEPLAGWSIQVIRNGEIFTVTFRMR